MRRMGIGLGIGINRSNYAQGIFNAYQSRVTADGGVTEAGACVDAVSGLLQSASLLLIPSGYKSGKAYAEIPTNGNGDLTWTRASTALRTNSSGLLESMGSGVPRLSYMYGSCPALLLEPQRTNLALRSDDFSNATWISDGTTTVTANATTSPDGTVNADRLQMSSSQRRYIYQNISVSAGTYTYSVYLKASSNQTVRIGTDQTCSFYRGALICNVTTEWQRFTLTITGVTAGNLAIVIDNITSNITQCTGTAVGVDIFAWGAQLELGAYPTTYIPTTTASATRVADTATKTGISSLIGQTEGVIFVDFYVNGIGANNINIYNNDRTPSTISTNAILYKPNGSIECQTFLGNGTFNTISISASTYTIGQRIKLAYRYKSGDFAVYINGIQKATSTSTMTFVGTKSQIYLDDNAVIYGYQESVHYNQFALFTTALTNAELVSLTT